MSWDEINKRPIRKTNVNKNRSEEIQRMFDINTQQNTNQQSKHRRVPTIRQSETQKVTQNNTQSEEIRDTNQSMDVDDAIMTDHSERPTPMSVDSDVEEPMQTDQLDTWNDRRLRKKRGYPASPMNVRRSARIAEKKSRL